MEVATQLDVRRADTSRTQTSLSCRSQRLLVRVFQRLVSLVFLACAAAAVVEAVQVPKQVKEKIVFWAGWAGWAD